MCETIKVGDSTAIICGVRRHPQRCKFCSSRNVVALCDFKRAEGKTCDAPLCAFHQFRMRPNEDLCPTHWRMNVMLPANRADMMLARWEQMDSRPCRLCRAPLEFWRSPAGKVHPLEVRGGDKLGTHFETCPHAAEFRRTRTLPPHRQGYLFVGANL